MSLTCGGLTDEARDIRNPDFIKYLNLLSESVKHVDDVRQVISASTLIKALNSDSLPKTQTEIANIFKEIDKDQDASKSFLIQLNQTKRGLMQDLLTGRVRVKFDGEATT